METPKEQQQPSLREQLLQPIPGTLHFEFDEATASVPWVKVVHARSWHAIIPVSDLNLSEPTNFGGSWKDPKVLRLEGEITWANLASAWLNEAKILLERQKLKAKRIIEDGILLLNADNNTRLDPRKVYIDWVNSLSNLSVKEFLKVRVTVEGLSFFLSEQITKWKRGYSPDSPSLDVNDIKNTINRKKNKRTSKENSAHIKDIWLGLEKDFWRIVKAHAANYIEESKGHITWNRTNDGISFLAGFISQCQRKGWIAKNSHSAPDFKRVLGNTFSIKFDSKPFQSGNLNEIDPRYTDPFKSIPQNVNPQNP